MTLSNEIQEAIKKQLPNMVATELQEFIKQAESDKASLLKSQKANEDLTAELMRTREKQVKLEALKYNADANEIEARKLADERRDLKVVLAEAKTKAAEDKTNIVVSLVTGLFRNAEYRRNMSTNNSENSSMANNYQPKGNFSSQNGTEEQV